MLRVDNIEFDSVGKAVVEALAASAAGVEEDAAASKDTDKKLLRFYGAKSYRDLAFTSTKLSIRRDGDVVSVQRWVPLKTGGLGPDARFNTTPENTPDEIGKAVVKVLEMEPFSD
jgi:hypothetical protein